MSSHPERETDLPPGLVYSTDAEAGIERIGRGRGFCYRNPDGSTVDANDLQRIHSLAIPPAYTRVWICSDPRGHLQATGRDARGRKQYRYHPEWIEAQAQAKFEHMVEFGQALPKIRARIQSDLATRGLNRNRVIAAIITLLERSLIRIGNDEYARQNQTYGLTTILADHAEVSTTSVKFKFIGKSGKPWNVKVQDRRLARIVRQLQDLPGQHLFDYLDEEGNVRRITSSDVNQYLREISPFDVTAKDFRTWAATREAFLALQGCQPCEKLGGRKKQINQVVKQIATLLGNTPAVCRASYIHPRVLECALQQLPIPSSKSRDSERALLKFLRETAELLNDDEADSQVAR